MSPVYTLDEGVTSCILMLACISLTFYRLPIHSDSKNKPITMTMKIIFTFSIFIPYSLFISFIFLFWLMLRDDFNLSDSMTAYFFNHCFKFFEFIPTPLFWKLARLIQNKPR